MVGMDAIDTLVAIRRGIEPGTSMTTFLRGLPMSVIGRRSWDAHDFSNLDDRALVTLRPESAHLALVRQRIRRSLHGVADGPVHRQPMRTLSALAIPSVDPRQAASRRGLCGLRSTGDALWVEDIQSSD